MACMQTTLLLMVPIRTPKRLVRSQLLPCLMEPATDVVINDTKRPSVMQRNTSMAKHWHCRTTVGVQDQVVMVMVVAISTKTKEETVPGKL